MEDNILYQDIPSYEESHLEEGVYYGVIRDVKAIADGKIRVSVELTLEDDTSHYVFIRTPLRASHSYDMIERLSSVCKTRKPIEFIGTELYASVKINTPTPSTRFENVIDIIECDALDVQGGYEITEKGYFIR